MIQRFFTFTSLIIMIFSFSASAVEFHSPRTLSLGGAGRATPLLGDSIYLNPSYASFSPVYSIGGNYTSIKEGGRNYNFTIMDSRTELFQAGIGYTRYQGSAAVNFGASKLAVSRLGFGLGSKFIIQDQNKKVSSDFIFSATYAGIPWLFSTIVIDNLMATFERTFYLGLKFIPVHNVMIFFDPLYTPEHTTGKKLGYHLGIEFGLLADFYFRIGQYRHGEIPYLGTRGNGFGLGAGWIGPKLNFDYALARALSTEKGDPFTSVHSFSTTIYF